MPAAGKTRLILTAMIFAVSMTFIDQTIVSLAIPELQKDLGLSATGTQWIINAYLLALAALFAFGGRLADIAGHRRMVVVGVILFAGASALCGATPTDADVAEPWMITFRVIQGAGAAIMFPAALAIVVAAFPVADRGKALAIFFGITGGLTAIGPFLGGYLTEWTWRSIFWVNVPVAVIALVLISIAKPDDTRTPAPIDWRGTALIAGGMGLAVLGLQQSSDWGWTHPATIACIAAGVLLLLAFVRVELRTRNPLIDVNVFRDRGFAAANGVLFAFSMAFIPVFFFTSMYAQISVGEDASSAGLFLLVFFAGFGGAAQWGGRMYDQQGVRAAVMPGCALAAVGFFFWARALDDFDLGDQWIWIVMAGAGCGLILGPASTDALNRVAATRYGEATGITQTVRNFGASVGLAVLGTVLILRTESNVEGSLTALGVPADRAEGIADAITSSGGGQASGDFGEQAGPVAERAFAAVRTDFANATETVFYVMAGIMAALYVIAHVWLPEGRVTQEQQVRGSAGSEAG
jgi:EmrB/QacA subfamily drug resistance transporter